MSDLETRLAEARERTCQYEYNRDQKRYDKQPYSERKARSRWGVNL